MVIFENHVTVLTSDGRPLYWLICCRSLKQKFTGQQSAHYNISHYSSTRNSAIADKLCDAFRGQSRSPNLLPFHMIGMVSH